MDTTKGSALETQVNPLEAYAENLLVDKGVLDLSSDVVEGMKLDLMDRLELLSTQVMLNGLKDDDLAVFEKMVDDDKSTAELQAFADEKVPDLAQRMTEALYRFRLTYLGEAA